jgi:site-specific DNA recombinase
LTSQRRGLERDIERWHAEIHTLVAAGVQNGGTPDISRLADLQERIRLAEQRSAESNAEIRALDGGRVSEGEVGSALSVFDPLWESLTPREQARIVQLLVQCVDYDGAEGRVSITFHPTGIKTLADEWAQHHQGEKP